MVIFMFVSVLSTLHSPTMLHPSITHNLALAQSDCIEDTKEKDTRKHVCVRGVKTFFSEGSQKV